MNMTRKLKRTRSKVLSGLIGASVLALVPLVGSAQDRDRGRDARDERLDPGTTISVRTSEGIDADHGGSLCAVDDDGRPGVRPCRGPPATSSASPRRKPRQATSRRRRKPDL